MKKIIIFILFLTNVAFANYHYNPRAGSSYYTRHSYSGTDIRGYSSHTGSIWSEHIDRNGNMSGINKRGQSWSYNRATGEYHNSNGKSCYGHGSARNCVG